MSDDAGRDDALPAVAGHHRDRTPWVPEGLPTFEVGDRVRVLSRPECYYCRNAEDEDGLIGTIERIGYRHWRLPSEPAEPGERDHIYWVGFPEEIGSSGVNHGHFAACELLPAARPAERGDLEAG